MVLEGLEREYRHDEDWCAMDKTVSIAEKAAIIASHIQKHQDQKVTPPQPHLCSWPRLYVSKALWI